MNPLTSIIGGFDIHVYFRFERYEFALKKYKDFLLYLESVQILPTCHNFFIAPEGPHLNSSFAVHLMGKNPIRDKIQDNIPSKAFEQLGYAISWLALNREDMNVLIHPNVAKPFGEVDKELTDHVKYGIWLIDYKQDMKMLSLSFFDDLLKNDANYAKDKARERLLKSKL